MRDLKAALEKCLEVETLRRKNLIRQRLERSNEPYFGKSEPILNLLRLCDVASANDSIALLLGETGTGKGVLARWIHDHSERAAEAFVELNCSSLKGELLRSELFGHIKGSFTSAIKDREGLIEVADGGTLFLDEIGDMDIEVQARLLKTIEEKSFRRIGENRVRKSDFRLLCATNRNLLKETNEGRFRKDLYYRICVFPINVPSLRQISDDIPRLAEHIVAGFGHSRFSLQPGVLNLLKSYSWPGNIRELRNMLERALLLAQNELLSPSHFPGLGAGFEAADPENDSLLLMDIEQKHISRVIAKFDGDKKRACEAMGISLSALYRRLYKFRNRQKSD
jgi:DNA-binding NtrC family response regulator